MAIRFTCENFLCGEPIDAPDGTAGRKGGCPHCQTLQRVPADAKSSAKMTPAKRPNAAPSDEVRQTASISAESVQSAAPKATLGNTYRTYEGADAGKQRKLPANKKLA